MNSAKSEQEIKQLHHLLDAKKKPKYATLGAVFEQFSMNAADALDSITGSGLLVRGESIVIYTGFSLRILSILFKIYLLYANWGQESLFESLSTIFELIIITLAALTGLLDILIAAIIGIFIAFYFLFKDTQILGNLLVDIVETKRFQAWWAKVVENPQPLLFTDEYSGFIEQLFVRQILLARKLQLNPDDLLEKQYAQIHTVTAELSVPNRIETLITLYMAMDEDFLQLQKCIHGYSEEEDLIAIVQLQQSIIDQNHEIKAYFAPYNQWNLADDVQNNVLIGAFAEASIGFYVSIAGLALALIGFLMCLNTVAATFPILAIAPLIIGIAMIIITVAFLIGDYIFNQEEDKQLELEVLEKANSGKFCTHFCHDWFKPMDSSTFFQKTIEKNPHYAVP